MAKRRGILERLDAGEVIIGDGGYVYVLERRGYMTPGEWTPDCVLEHPEAVAQAHRDFAHCGADILQAFVYNGTDDNLNFARKRDRRPLLDCDKVNEEGCRLVTEVANANSLLVGLPVTTTRSYQAGLGKEKVQAEFKKQVDVFKGVTGDLIMAEYIGTVEEGEWAVEIMKTAGVPVSISLCIGPLGDFNGVSVEECGVRLVKAGADIIGINCRFDPNIVVDTTIRMKNGVEAAGLKCHYMTQPIGYHTQDAINERIGFVSLPECPLAFESRLINRFDAQKYARKAYEAGIRYIGGCCGFEPYHIRALAEELREERGKLPKSSRCVDACTLEHHENLDIRKERANKNYWLNLIPYDGRKPREELTTKA